MDFIYIVTPLSRPENIDTIYRSIFTQMSKPIHPIKVCWCVVLDNVLEEDVKKSIEKKYKDNKHVKVVRSPITKSFVGHSHRNYFLNNIYDICRFPAPYWVYFLDDDTILHPDFFQESASGILQCNRQKHVIIFNQANKDSSMRLRADINKVKVCHIDMGMYMFNLQLIPMQFFKEDDYCADGIFAEELMTKLGPDKFLHIDKILSYYNFLRT